MVVGDGGMKWTSDQTLTCPGEIKVKPNPDLYLVNQDESGLCNDMGFLAHLPELCDITFMVGEEKEPVCAVRAVLGTHSVLTVPYNQ